MNSDTILCNIKIQLDLFTQNNSFEVLLKKNQISLLKKKFEEGITDLLEEAKRRKVKNKK